MQLQLRALLPLCACSLPLVLGIGNSPAAEPTKDEARAAMHKAAEYYCEKVAVGGGYVYHYSLDLEQRWGEGVAQADQIWVQPPGTPTVGLALLAAYRATGDEYYLKGAQAAAEALAWGQLSTGGWANQISLTHRDKVAALRKEGVTSLDDGQTQSALLLVMEVDKALDFRHPQIHKSAEFGLDSLLKAQFPNGAFPQGWRAPVEKHPVMAASYPDYDWRTEGRIKNYWDMYTLNDNVCGYVANTLIAAHRIYKDDRYLNALRKLGDFLLLAQMPEPQPGWAQQYNYEMKPIWARKFEPPGVSGDESQEALETLLRITVVTGDKKYLEPFPTALAYLRKSLLPDNRLARYYELKTNRPLYMVRPSKNVYQLTYDDSKLPSHYGWKTPSRLDEIEADYQQLLKTGTLPKQERVDATQVRQVIDSLDEQGRWISTYQGELLIGQLKLPLGTEYIASQVFSDNLNRLSAYLSEN